MLNIHIYLTLFSIIFLSFSSCNDDEWIDPYQMVFDTPASAKEGKCDEVIKQLSVCNDLLKNSNAQIERNDNKADLSKDDKLLLVYSKKLLLLMNSQLCQDEKSSKDFQSTYTVTPSVCKSLRKPFEDALNLNEIYKLLEEIFHYQEPLQDHSAYLHPSIKWFKVDNIPFFIGLIPLWTWFLIKLITLLLGVRISFKSVFIYFIFVVFFVSILWNWWLLYKKEVAEQRVILMKKMPAECMEETWMSWLEGLIRVESNVCQRYQEALEIDAVWQVSPLKAIMVTLSKLVLDPLEQLGSSLMKIVKMVLADLPVFIQYLLIPVLFLFLILLVLIVCRFRLRTWFFSIEPTYGRDINHSEIKCLKEEFNRLKSTQSEGGYVTAAGDAPMAAIDRALRGTNNVANDYQIKNDNDTHLIVDSANDEKLLKSFSSNTFESSKIDKSNGVRRRRQSESTLHGDPQTDLSSYSFF